MKNVILFTAVACLPIAVYTYGAAWHHFHPAIGMTINAEAASTGMPKAAQETAQVHSLDRTQIEALVLNTFRRQGFEVAEKPGHSGIDLIITNDHKAVLIQGKPWEKPQVGARDLQKIYSIVADRGLAYGIVITSGTYTPDARRFARNRPLVLLSSNEIDKMIH